MSTGADMTVDIGGGGGGGPDLRELVDAIKDQSGKMATLTTSIGELVTKMDSLTKSSGKGQKAQKASQTADPAAAAEDEGHNRMSEMDSLRKLRRTTARHMTKVNDGRSVTIAALDKLTGYQDRASRILKRAVEGGEIGKFGTIAESLQFEMDKLSKAFQKKRQVIKRVISEQALDKQTKKEEGEKNKVYNSETNVILKSQIALQKLEKQSNLLLKRRNKEGEVTRTLVYTFEDLNDKMEELKSKILKLDPSYMPMPRLQNPEIIKKSYENQENNKLKNKKESELNSYIESFTKLSKEQNLLFDRSRNLKKISNKLIYTFEDLDKEIEIVKNNIITKGGKAPVRNENNTANIKDLQIGKTRIAEIEKKSNLVNKLKKVESDFYLLYDRLKDKRKITEALADKFTNLFDKMNDLSKRAYPGLGGYSNNKVTEIKELREKQIKEGKITKEDELRSSVQSLIDKFREFYKSVNDGSNITKGSIKSLKNQAARIIELSNPALKTPASREKRDKHLNSYIENTEKARDLQVKTKSKNRDDKTQKKKEDAFTKEYDYWSNLNRKMQLLGGHFKLSAKAAVGLIMELEEFENKGKTMGKAGYTTSSSPFKGLSDELNTKLEEAKGRASKGSSGEKPKETFLQSAAKQVNPATLGISVLQTALSSMTGAITGIAGALLGSPIVAVITAVLAPFQSLMAVVGKVITVLVNWIMIATGLMGFLKRLELSLDAFAARIQLINDVTLSLDTAVQRASSGIATSMANLGSGVVGAVDNVLSNPLTGLLDIVDNISKFVGLVNPGLMDRYNKVLENLMALIGSALQPVVSEITSLLYIFGTQLKPIIGMIGGQLAVAVRAFAMAILPVIPDLIRGLLALAQTLIGFVADVGVKLATEGPGNTAKENREERIKAEEEKLVKFAYGDKKDDKNKEGRDYLRQVATDRVDQEIKNEQPAADFMDSAIAKNAKFSSGMDMGKSSVQKAFESSSAYGQDPSDQQTLDAAQAEFYKNPAAWVKKAMAGAENKPRQQVGGNVGGEAGGPNKVQAMMMLARMAGAVAGAPAAALRDVGIIT